MGSIVWGPEIAARYDESSAGMFAPEVLEPAVELLAELADGGPVLEFALGTGRVALPLQARGLRVQGIELSPHMVERFRSKPGSETVPVVVGDMTSVRVQGGPFRLVLLVWNSIMNVTTQEEQVAVFANAAAHLEAGGRFLVEVAVPPLRRFARGESAQVFSLEPDHVGIDTLDDPVRQIMSSHHWIEVDGRLARDSAPYRYVWPSELDLMALLAGMRLENRWGGWRREPFTGDSESHVSVWRNASQPPG
jgi:SAM-dependent methyltransferase